jgi:HAD superfamily hydrolase (TIGR01509 family)
VATSRKIRAVIFDMDGTLIEAKDWHYEALNDALGIFGESISRVEHESRFNGLPTKDKLIMLTKDGRIPEHLHSIISRVKQERTIRRVVSHCFPVVQQLLMMSWIKESGLKIAVATNSIRNSAQIMLTSAGLIDFLDLLVTNEDVKYGKPNPEMYLLVANRLGLDPSECLVIEDHQYGIEAALAAGCAYYKIDSVDSLNSRLIQELLSR